VKKLLRVAYKLQSRWNNKNVYRPTSTVLRAYSVRQRSSCVHDSDITEVLHTLFSVHFKHCSNLQVSLEFRYHSDFTHFFYRCIPTNISLSRQPNSLIFPSPPLPSVPIILRPHIHSLPLLRSARFMSHFL